MGVTQDQGTPRHDIVNILFPVDILYRASGSRIDEYRGSPHRAESANRAVDPARYQGLGALPQFL
jgi:hypothetical protein